MFASQFVSDAAVFAPQSHRGRFSLEPRRPKAAEGRKGGLLAILRGLFSAHGTEQLSASRG